MEGFYYWNDKKKGYTAYIKCMGVEVHSKDKMTKKELDEYVKEHSYVIFTKVD